MSEPIFDSRGWCHNMMEAPCDYQLVMTWCQFGRTFRHVLAFHDDHGWIADDPVFGDTCDMEVVPLAWRPLPLPPEEIA
jgi:hypothetical protein